eukprot:Em0004g305a
MKKVNWTKVSKQQASSPSTVWHKCAHNAVDIAVRIEPTSVEDLFSREEVEKKGAKDEAKEKAKPTSVALLDSKTSLNVNIFLKQFKSSNEAIVSIISSGNCTMISLDQLKALEKLLPDQPTVETLKSYKGDHALLGPAEDFFMRLLEVKQYPLRLEALQLQMEFAEKVESLKPSIETLSLALEEILSSENLRQILYIALVTGNIINGGGKAGDAYGFTLSSLGKLNDTRANRPRMAFLHFIIEVCEKERREILELGPQLPHLEAASKLSQDYLSGQVTELTSKIKALQQKAKKAPEDIKPQLNAFLEKAHTTLDELTASLGATQKKAERVIEYFCEDSKKTKLEDIFSQLLSFMKQLHAAMEENRQRAAMEEKKRKREEAKKATPQTNKRFQPTAPGENVIDNLLKEIREGTTLSHGGGGKKVSRQQLSSSDLEKIKAMASQAASVIDGKEKDLGIGMSVQELSSQKTVGSIPPMKSISEVTLSSSTNESCTASAAKTSRTEKVVPSAELQSLTSVEVMGNAPLGGTSTTEKIECMATGGKTEEAGPAFTTEKAEISITAEKRAEPGVTTENTELSVKTAKIEPAVTAANTEPAVTAANTGSAVTAANTEPAVTAANTEPAVTAANTEPAFTAANTEPAVTAANTEPAVTATITESAVIAANTEPAFTAVRTESIVTAAITEPAVTERKMEPVATKEEMEPGATPEKTEPTELSDTAVKMGPAISMEKTKSVIAKMTELPATEMMESAVKDEKMEPAVMAEKLEPSVNAKVTDPAVTAEKTKTAIINNNIEPTEMMQTAKPGVALGKTVPAVAMGKTVPAVAMEKTEPAVAMEKTEPTLSVGKTEPTVSVGKTVAGSFKLEPAVTIGKTEPTVTTKETQPAATAEKKEQVANTEHSVMSEPDVTQPSAMQKKKRHETISKKQSLHANGNGVSDGAYEDQELLKYTVNRGVALASLAMLTGMPLAADVLSTSQKAKRGRSYTATR